MGSDLCVSEKMNEFDSIIDPLSSQFQQSTPSQIQSEFDEIFEKIKKIKTIVDPRPDKNLRWYKSKKFGFKMYGSLHRRRPFGQCLFYFDPALTSSEFKQKKQSEKKSPILITSNINKHYLFCSNTLLIYSDRSYYIGQIEAKVYHIPRASGQGLLVTKDFIYEGEFEEGLPEGFGRYRTKYFEYVGKFKAGAPCGDCVEKTSEGMFVGTITPTVKTGFMITPQNKKVDFKRKIKGTEGNIEL